LIIVVTCTQNSFLNLFLINKKKKKERKKERKKEEERKQTVSPQAH